MRNIYNKVYNSVCWRVKRVKYRIPGGRDENPYSTHIPILVGIAGLVKIKRVIEFGCGRYSTQTFLDRFVFPDLEELYSLENDAQWFKEMKNLTSYDLRVNLVHIEGSMSNAVPGICFDSYDMILIDDSKDVESRSATINAVMNHCSSSNIIVFHDSEVKDYRDAVNDDFSCFAITAFNPNTGIAWKDELLDFKRIKRLDVLTKKLRWCVSPEKRRCWRFIFKLLM